MSDHSETRSADAEPGHILRDWDARQYLDYYYGHRSVPDDEAAMFRFFADALRGIGAVDAGLELGCGPVLHHAAQVVPWVARLDMADVQDPNLEEIRRWLRRDPAAFDWSIFLDGRNGVLDAEDRKLGSLAEREALMRARIQLMSCDLRDAQPLGKPVQYPLVASYYCAEWVVPTQPGWRETMTKVAGLVARGGWLLLAGVHATDYCMINGRRVPCARVTDDALREVLGELGFDPGELRISVTPGLRPWESGIQGTFMAYAHRSR